MVKSYNNEYQQPIPNNQYPVARIQYRITNRNQNSNLKQYYINV